MDGFKVNYINSKGVNETTFFGPIITNIDMSNQPQKEAIGIISMFFYNAHPGCSIVSIEKCTYDDFSSSSKTTN